MRSAHHGKGLAALIGASLLWSTGGFFIKSIPLSALTIAGGRSAIAAIVLLLYIRSPKPTWSLAQWGSILAYVATVVLFVTATKLTTAANAILLQYTAPIWVAVFSALIAKEKLRLVDGIAVAAVMLGMGVFFIEQVSADHLTGDVIAILSGVAFAFVALCMRAQRGVSLPESILFGNIITAVVCLPFIDAIPMTSTIVLNLVLMGVVQLGISYILYSYAMRYVTAIEAVLITMLEPLLNPLWVLLTIGEVPSIYATLGGAIVLGSVVVRGIVVARR